MEFCEDKHFGVHALLDAEYTLCGVAFDLNIEDEDIEAIPVSTNKKIVTCQLCIKYIKACRELRFK